jgi:protein-S-isoprenylcysteine O-methyltransferase Ste14
MDIKLKLTILFSCLYGVFELVMGMRQRMTRTSDIVASGDKASIWTLLFLIGIGYFLSFNIFLAETGRIYHWDILFAIGSVFFITGSLIRIRSILTLKEHFTYTVAKIEDHEIIETGLYKKIRHPGYLGQLIIFLGVSISLSNWLSVILMIVPVFLGFMIRINVEEKFMAEHMGQAYLDYRKRTKRLIPMIY